MLATCNIKKDILLSNCKIPHHGSSSGANKLSNDDYFCIHVDSSLGKIKNIIPYVADLNNYERIIAYNDKEVDVIDCQGYMLSPGFIDIQINGCHGVDFSSPTLTKEDVIRVSKILPQYGVTSFCPTIISSSNDVYKRNISILSELCHKNVDNNGNNGDNNHENDEEGRSKILGLHLEGPFFALSKKGAHNGSFIKEEVSMSLLSNIYSLSPNNTTNNNIKIITMAPELKGALSTIQSLTSQGIIVSMGHTDATLAEGMDGIKNGATLITHLFNAMKPFHHREPGLLGLIQPDDKRNETQFKHDKGNSLSKSHTTSTRTCPPFFSIIADGLHSHPSAVKMAYSLNPSKLILVTDAMSAMGLGSGTHTLGSMTVTIHNNKATLANSDLLAGSVVSLDTCLKNLQLFTNCSVNDALAGVTFNPSRLLGCEKDIGTLCIGSSADFVLLDDDLNVMKTWINGKIVYDGGSSHNIKSRKRKCMINK